MIEWIKWRLGIGWNKSLVWIGGGPDYRVEDGMVILWEEYWRNRKTGEARIVRGVRPATAEEYTRATKRRPITKTVAGKSHVIAANEVTVRQSSQ